MNWVLNGEAKYFLLDVAPCLPFNRKQAVLLATTLDGMTGAQTAQVDSGAERAEFCRDSHPSRLVRAAIATSAE